MLPKYKVLIDTREQIPLSFPVSTRCIGSEVVTLKTGDYTLQGYEDILCIERKKSISEFAKNLTEERFERELERMRSFNYYFIVLEFEFSDLTNFPFSSNIPKSKWSSIKVSGNFLLKRLCEIQLSYNVNVVFAGSRDGARMFISSLFKRVIENEKVK